MSWSAAQYLKFNDERTRPVRDLVAALPAIEAHAAIDIGCGPGNSTEVLAERFPNAGITGLDSSADMIAAARKRLPNVRFEVADIESWINEDARPLAPGQLQPGRASRQAPGPGRFDVILANAVLHWVPNHAALFPQVAARLSPGGALAIQMPDNLDEPAQRLMRDLAANGPWAKKLARAAGTRVPIESADWYYNVLRAASTRTDIWRSTYYHPLAGESEIVEWFKGSGLRPFLEPLDDPERADYLARYTAAVKSAYPPLSDGTVLLPFPRLFIVAIR
jgi:trans-aconitate 2-methyltransferase